MTSLIPRRPIQAVILFAWVLVGRSTVGLAEESPPVTPTPRIQIALLLDTSNSMDGLIDQARTQLWKVVNDLVSMKRSGQRPVFQVALYEYGNQGLAAESGYVRQILPLTNDLDRVSEELFALHTNGGDEYCGTVIQHATKHLHWSRAANDMKMIVIAGNEPFSQGTVDFRAVCRQAIRLGVMVNTIHCGPGIPDDWREGALLADGKAMNIDQDQVLVHIPAPQDEELARLGVELNSTYVAFGREAEDGRGRQLAQDALAREAAPGAQLDRVVAKSSRLYSNAQWDLVDAIRESTADLEELAEEDLPENMKPMTPAERKAYVEKQSERRQRVQDEIKKLSVAREQYLEAERAKAAPAAAATLDQVLRDLIREQARDKGFEHDAP